MLPLWLLLMALASVDTFTGGDDADIAGRTPDGGGNPALAVGTWTWVHGFGGPSDHVVLNIEGGVVVHEDVPGVPSGVEPRRYILPDLGIGGNHGVEVAFKFVDYPIANDPGVTLYLRRQNDLTGAEYQLLIMRSGSGDTAEIEAIYVGEQGDIGDNRVMYVDFEAFEIDYDHTYLARFCISANNVIQAYVDTVLVFEFDLATDLDLFDDELIPVLSGGFPGFGIQDGPNGPGGGDPEEPGVQVSQVSVDTGCVECEGPPTNPWPLDPPPVEEIPPAMWVMANGGWRLLPAPSETDHQASPYAIGSPRLALAGSVMANGSWRTPTALGDTDPPPNTDEPPYYDPCELLPPLEPPPTEPLEDPPARLFFAYDHPITQLGVLFTAAMNAMGAHTPGNLAQAIARDSQIIGAQGGYTKFQSGGSYQQSLMDAWIESHAPYMAGLLTAQSAGDFYGVQTMDDHASQPRWNWPGWSPSQITSEISRIVAKWKTEYPGIRVGLRARAAQFNSGTGIPANVDFIIAQYRYWGLGGLTPTQFRDQELSLCTARGWNVLFSINIENGGLGGSGISHRVMWEMTPSEVENALTTFCVANSRMHGVGLWKYSAEVLGRTGMQDALARVRNALAALGPP